MAAMTKGRETKKFLFKLRHRDSEFGVSEETFNRLMNELSLNQTELVHKALRDLAEKTIPAYEPDDGPLTDTQIETIRKLSPIGHLDLSDIGSPLLGDN
ncbi:hypothetical protein Xbed_03072 [Xenorhabdus beddingii]|uniref:Uncharacterized protein n=1 Tax=Xenorhabdus beddingii TaxID=40578 RepID=A0A1Y2SIU9_9GAMM|nr:hypothetical protein [Xenorhabdus beddingii]OTA18627.1 hypothetical protein Xbed_03072 [Xenorhabdus beddingii]